MFLKDQASSRLIEVIIRLAHKSILRDLYKDHLKGQLVDLALHPIANFPVQRLTAAAATYKLVSHNVGTSHDKSQDFVFAGMIPFSFSSTVPEVV